MDVTGLRIFEPTADEIVHRQLDGLLRRDTHELRRDTRIKTQKTLVPNDFSETINGIVIQLLSNSRGPLVLHASLDEVDGIHHEGAESAGQTSQGEVPA